MRGYCRPYTSSSEGSLPSLSVAALDDRLLQLQAQNLSSAYAKQKSSLHSQLSAFLASLPGNKTPFNATPKDLCRFLAWKDSCGKTQVHKMSCPHLGKRGKFGCSCPVRLAYATVDSYTAKLRALCKSLGRVSDWNSSLDLGNPAASEMVKDYLKAFTMEQLQAAVTPRQATPIFPTKLAKLMSHIKQRMSEPGISPGKLFILARDHAVFSVLTEQMTLA